MERTSTYKNAREEILSHNGRHEVLPFTNPATGERFGEVVMATADEVRRAQREMAAAAEKWAAKPVKERVRILRRLQQVMIDNTDEITAVMNQDGGKSRQDALAEVFVTVNLIDEYCKHAPDWLHRKPAPTGLQIFKRAYIERRPFGVVGVIGPWNYPLVLLAPPMVSALLAGNTVLVKPSEVTAATGVMIEGLVKRVPDLKPFVRFLHGDATVGAALVDSRPDLVYLTGSTKTGHIITQKAAETMMPVICELGGKDPMIVLEDADVAAAARWGAWGAFYNTGQTCMAVERVYVVASVYDEFLRRVIEEAKHLKIGYSPATDNENDLGPLTFRRQIDIIEDHVQDALDKGAQIVLGGERDGMYLTPMILTNVDHSMRIMYDETFGPIMPIMKVNNEREAIYLANDSQFGLSASVWSRDLERAQRVAAQLEVGSVVINDTISHFGMPHVPFGGVKLSGLGRTHGEQDILQFTTTRAIITGNPPLPFDIATFMRSPGHYDLGKGIMQLAFGVTPQQRLEPLTKMVEENKTVQNTLKVAGAAAVIGAAVWGLSRLKKS